MSIYNTNYPIQLPMCCHYIWENYLEKNHFRQDKYLYIYNAFPSIDFIGYLSLTSTDHEIKNNFKIDLINYLQLPLAVMITAILCWKSRNSNCIFLFVEQQNQLCLLQDISDLYLGDFDLYLGDLDLYLMKVMHLDFSRIHTMG